MPYLRASHGHLVAYGGNRMLGSIGLWSSPAGLFLGCSLFFLISFCSYVRKLRALKALKVASKFSPGDVVQGPAIPGTNRYNTEGYAFGAGPVLLNWTCTEFAMTEVCPESPDKFRKGLICGYTVERIGFDAQGDIHIFSQLLVNFLLRNVKLCCTWVSKIKAEAASSLDYR